VRTTNEAAGSGLPVAVHVLDIHTVGAGGGSIARVDEGGSLRVGPESAGADPGPACYGRSLLPTVTDAHLVLGHFGGAGLLGGEFKLDETRAEEALNQLAREMSAAAGRRVALREAAQGVLSVVNTGMERALRVISVERGYDPREFSLMPFGGAGGLHAVDLARSLRVPRIIAPSAAGALSALGALAADVVKDWSRTLMLEATPEHRVDVESAFREMEREARMALRREGFSAERQRHERMLGVRYKGPSFELEIKWHRGGYVAKDFHRAHRARYGYVQEDNVVEIVSSRLRSTGIVNELKKDRARRVTRQRTLATPHDHTTIYLAGRKRSAAIYRRDDLQAGTRLRSPCIVTEYSSTTLIPPGASASVDNYGNIIIEP
jgi:N-methylhydantoinase A